MCAREDRTLLVPGRAQSGQVTDNISSNGFMDFGCARAFATTFTLGGVCLRVFFGIGFPSNTCFGVSSPARVMSATALV
jgi:hypothetical protein